MPDECEYAVKLTERELRALIDNASARGQAYPTATADPVALAGVFRRLTDALTHGRAQEASPDAS